MSGTRRHGRSRIVPVRAQNKIPPVIGLNLPASGPQEPATPIASSSTVHSTAFWYTTGWFHHWLTCQNAGSRDVVVATTTPPRT